MKSWAMEMDLSPTHGECFARAPCQERSPPPPKAIFSFSRQFEFDILTLCFLGMVSQVARDVTINRSNTRRGDVAKNKRLWTTEI